VHGVFHAPPVPLRDGVAQQDDDSVVVDVERIRCACYAIAVSLA
jgi:hypothetical protein